jgi:hypothetical protein
MGLTAIAFTLLVQGVTFDARLNSDYCICTDQNRKESYYCQIDDAVINGRIIPYVVLLDVTKETVREAIQRAPHQVDVGCFVLPK